MKQVLFGLLLTFFFVAVNLPVGEAVRHCHNNVRCHTGYTPFEVSTSTTCHWECRKCQKQPLKGTCDGLPSGREWKCHKNSHCCYNCGCECPKCITSCPRGYKLITVNTFAEACCYTKCVPDRA